MAEQASFYRDPRLWFCEGGSATCAACVGSCGIEEYEDTLDVAVRDLTDSGERLTVEELAESVGVDPDDGAAGY